MIRDSNDFPPNIIDLLKIDEEDMEDEDYSLRANLLLPGDKICEEKGFMHGHGTFEEDGVLYANVVGMKQQTNQLITVVPIRSKYLGEIGDVVIGRVIEISNRRWLVDIESYNYAILNLNSINLPSGEQRRKTEEDEMNMRQYYQENDIIVAEIHSLNNDKTINLHSRSQKYGKIKKARNHFVEFKTGVSLILGHNGVIWLGSNDKNDLKIDSIRRESIARIRNCIKILNDESMDINAESINELYEESNNQNLSVKDLLNRTKIEALSGILLKKLKLKIPQEMKNALEYIDTAQDGKSGFLNFK